MGEMLSKLSIESSVGNAMITGKKCIKTKQVCTSTSGKSTGKCLISKTSSFYQVDEVRFVSSQERGRILQ